MLEFILAIMITTAVVGYDVAHASVDEPISTQVVEVPTPTPIPTDIVGYTRFKFGEDADKALKVLKCENRNLDPEAVNDNRKWGGVGVDRGYWQINNHYHPITDECAKDVVCSTDYSYRMYLNDNKTFVRWTCGRSL